MSLIKGEFMEALNDVDGLVVSQQKEWSGLLKEGLTDADNFAVTFPLD